MVVPAMENVLRVCVTGAAGQIAYSLLPLIANGSIFGKNKPVSLRLLEIEKALGALAGVAMELTDGAYPLLRDVVQTHDPMIAFDGIDVAILVGAFPRLAGMERKDLLARNGSIFKIQGNALNKVAKPDVKVVVVGNPANTNAMILSTYAPDIPKENITALTRLDHNRTLAQIALKCNASLDQVDGVSIWGNHSSTQYPCVINATVEGKPVLDKLGGLESLKSDFIPLIQKRGAAVISARGSSSAMSAANAIADHMRSWISGDSKVVSMAVPSDGSYGIREGIYFSFPVRCPGGGKYEIVKDVQIDDFSQNYINDTAEELYSERSVALSMLE